MGATYAAAATATNTPMMANMITALEGFLSSSSFLRRSLSFAIIGVLVAVAAAAYGIYRFFTPDYLDDFDDEYDDEFDDDFFEDEDDDDAEEEKEAPKTKEEK